MHLQVLVSAIQMTYCKDWCLFHYVYLTKLIEIRLKKVKIAKFQISEFILFFSLILSVIPDCERSLVWGEKGVGGTAVAASASHSELDGPQYAWLGNKKNSTQVSSSHETHAQQGSWVVALKNHEILQRGSGEFNFLKKF